ncbi:hypothetical protein E8E12_010693 [Didymella heteroderae]|uniref:Uncharacterized protein n=1 Tax=Didymella heteroderae TaxID=1769908 RepID=A0A9P4WX35_9PLEO|nr:hypothetical protein E8E12_010693 [Didymella heteroderae]
MATSQYCDISHLADGHPQSRPITSSIPPYHTNNAMENSVHGVDRAETRVAAPQGSFTFYKTYLDTNVPLLGEQDSFGSDDDGYTCHSGAAATGVGSVDDAQPHARGHTAAYKLAVRLANRSNGVPLATIIEQGSYSTLNSRGSLLSVGRFPSIKAAENTTPSRDSRRRSRSLDEKALHDIQEDLTRESDASAVLVPPMMLNEELEAADPASGTATPLKSYCFEYMFDGVPVDRGYLPSTGEASSTRELFTSQNASFCSTMTSSYSGAVLGVDLDLQHDFSRLIRRSQSPPTPVWFTPQLAELERQASFSESPESVKAILPSHAPARSIKSSALTSLLPIAAASGIVQPNYKTPKISFYSPSGNLIQPERSSPQDTRPSERGGSPTGPSSYYNRQNVNPGSSPLGSPIRPPLVPKTTPPAHKTPLPSHLRHHHNYRRPEISEISPHKSSVTLKGSVKGCDGMVRENSLTPRSGVFYPHDKDKVHRPVRLAVHDLKTEVKFYKARFITLAAAHSFTPSMPKGKTLQKRHIRSYSTYDKNPRVDTGEDRRAGYRQDALGPMAAYALRVCFCQPYDDAGVPTHATTVGACMVGC